MDQIGLKIALAPTHLVFTILKHPVDFTPYMYMLCVDLKNCIKISSQVYLNNVKSKCNQSVHSPFLCPHDFSIILDSIISFVLRIIFAVFYFILG